jgi:hypothetical protein
LFGPADLGIGFSLPVALFGSGNIATLDCCPAGVVAGLGSVTLGKVVGNDSAYAVENTSEAKPIPRESRRKIFIIFTNSNIATCCRGVYFLSIHARTATAIIAAKDNSKTPEWCLYITCQTQPQFKEAVLGDS